MTDATEEKIARDKAAVDAMRNAKSNMDAALARISALESALQNARDHLLQSKGYIAAGVYTYPGQSQSTVHDRIDGYIAAANKALG